MAEPAVGVSLIDGGRDRVGLHGQGPQVQPVGPRGAVRAEPGGPAGQQCGGAGEVAALDVRQTDAYLRETLPQLAFLVGAGLPAGLQHLVGVERASPPRAASWPPPAPPRRRGRSRPAPGALPLCLWEAACRTRREGVHCGGDPLRHGHAWSLRRARGRFQAAEAPGDSRIARRSTRKLSHFRAHFYYLLQDHGYRSGSRGGRLGAVTLWRDACGTGVGGPFLTPNGTSEARFDGEAAKRGLSGGRGSDRVRGCALDGLAVAAGLQGWDPRRGSAVGP